MVSLDKRESGFAKAWLLAGVLGIIVVGGALAVLAGYAYAGFKTPMQQPVLAANVCKLTDIEKYNALADPSNKSADRKGFISSVTSREGYDKDASCVYMLAQSYIITNDTESARTMAGKLRELANGGNFADLRIKDLSGIDQLDATLRSTNTDGPAPVGEG